MNSSHFVIKPIDISDIHRIGCWHDRFALFCKTNSDIDDTNKIAFYLTLVGKQAYDLLVDLVYPRSVEDKSIEDLKMVLENHLKPVNFEANERAKFHNIIRRHDEKLCDFLL